MSSKRRIAASRANGKKSHGPVTPEGKARSAANARACLDHGLASPDRAGQSVILHNENRAEFMLLYESLVAEHLPVTPSEHLAVHEIATTTWRINRALSIETSLLDLQMDDMLDETRKTYLDLDEPTRLALGFRRLSEQTPALALLFRYEGRLVRQLDRAHKRLANLRENAANTDENANLPTEPSPISGHWPGTGEDTEESTKEHDQELPIPNSPNPPDQPLPGPAAGTAEAAFSLTVSPAAGPIPAPPSPPLAEVPRPDRPSPAHSQPAPVAPLPGIAG